MNKDIEYSLPNEQTFDRYKFAGVTRFFSHLFSVVFHPLFIPFYVVGFLVYYHPSYFSGFSFYSKFVLLRSTAVNTILFPAFALLVMKGLGFVRSVFLHTQQDRIGPYLANMIFYFWMARVCFNFRPELTPVLGIVYDRRISYYSRCLNCQYIL